MPTVTSYGSNYFVIVAEMPVLFTFALYTSCAFVNNQALVGRMYYYDNFHSNGVSTVENYGTARYQFELLTHSYVFGPK